MCGVQRRRKYSAFRWWEKFRTWHIFAEYLKLKERSKWWKEWRREGFPGQKTSKDLSEWTWANSDVGFADLVGGSGELAVSPILCIRSSFFLLWMLQPWTLTLGSGRSLHCWTSSTRSGGSSSYLHPLPPTITTASRWPTYRWSTTGRTTMSDGSWLCCCFVAQTEAKHW